MSETVADVARGDGQEGITWRPPVQDDVPAIVALYDVCCDADGTYRAAPSEILDHWDSQSISPSTDALMGFTEEGTLVSAIWSIVPESVETLRRAFGYENRIHPEYRTEAMRDRSLDWWEVRSRQRLANHDDDLPRLLYQFVFAQQTAEIAYYESRGYEIVRYFHELGRSLAAPLGPVVMPPAIEIRPLETNRADAHKIRNVAFRDHWGSQPATVAAWAETFNEFYMPDASFVAYEGDEPVGYILSAVYPHDFEDRGWPHFWIEAIGTLRSHRKRGIASGLISMAMETMRRVGMEFVILGVDAENPTGAYGLYERLGFGKLREEIALEKKA